MTAHRCTVCGGDLDTGARCHNPACSPPVTAPAARTLAEIGKDMRRQARSFRTVILDTDEAMALLAVAEAADKREATLRAAAREALTVLTRLADSAYQWAGRDVPPGLVSEIDAAKARLAGVLGE